MEEIINSLFIVLNQQKAIVSFDLEIFIPGKKV